MSCELVKVNLISPLCDDVLLHIFGYLNWIDSINLAATCKRMKSVQYWVNKQNQEFDLSEFVEKVTVPIENVLSAIGPYIRVAKISANALSAFFMETCVNIKSVKIDGSVSQSVAITLNTWMKQLKIDELSIGQGFEDFVVELLDGITGLNSFVFDSFQQLLPRNFFDKNSSMQHLLLTLPDEEVLALNLSFLQVLDKLKSLSLTVGKTDVLDDVRKYVKMNQLIEFSIYIMDWDADIWDTFAEHLAQNTKIEKLRISGYVEIDEPTFSTLNSFNLTSLCLEVAFLWECFSMALRENTASQLKYLRLRWPIAWCNSTKIAYILKMWSTVEAICFNLDDESNLLHHFKDQFFIDILEISHDRPGLKLHIFCSEVSFRKTF